MEKQHRYRKHPDGVDLYFYVPHSIVEFYRNGMAGELEYIDVLGFGKIPIQSHNIKMLEYEKFDINSIDWTDFAHGFFDGYNSDFATHIGTIESKKEAIVKTISNQKSICVTRIGKNITLNYLYDDGYHHGRQYKAWEIIFETPNQFIDYFNDDTGTTDKKPLHFTRSFTPVERQRLFDGLVTGSFIPKDTNLDHFNFVFGGAETADFEPLQWIETAALLAYFIDNCFAGKSREKLWKTTECCFTINGEKPNADSLKNAASKIKADTSNPPKEHNKIDNILSGL